MVVTYLLILKHVGFSKINTEACQKWKTIQLSCPCLVNECTPTQLNFTITSNFDNNFLTSSQNISFDLQAITQLKQLLAVFTHMTSQYAILTKTL